MLMVGSRVIPGFYRKSIDYDVICSQDDFVNLVTAKAKTSKIDKMGRTPGGAAAIFQDGTILDAEIVGISEKEPEKAIDAGIDSHRGYILFGGIKVPAASPEFIYTLKMSHRFRKNVKTFLKTMRDIQWLRSNGYGVVTDEGFLKSRQKATLSYWHPSLNKTKSDFFTDDVGYQYDHDSIHRAVAVESSPAYTQYLKDGAEVDTDKDKFFSVSQRTRLLGVLEESYVLALERSIIPFGEVPEKAFLMALEKVCTSITSGYFREFAWEHYDEVLSMYNPDFVDKFNAALSAGKIEAFKK